MAIYEAMIRQCGWSVVQILVFRVDIGVVIYEAMTLYGTPVGQFLVARVDTGVSYESKNSVWAASGSGPGCQSGYKVVTHEVMRRQCVRPLLWFRS